MQIVKIEGVGATYAEKLRAAGVRTTQSLLRVAAGKKGRKDLADVTGLTEKQILEWVNRADLMRVRGVGEEYSDLLEQAGVDTVKELRNRNPQNLHRAIADINEAKNLVRRTPSLSEVERWVKIAKTMEPMVTY